MPELPEVEAVRLELAPVLVGRRVTGVRLHREGLRRRFPDDFEDRLAGRTVRQLTRRGKYLLAELSSRETLVMHLGMSGSFRVEPMPSERRPPQPHDHVEFAVSSGLTIVFNDPRRFGLMDLVAPGQLDAALRLGPEPLDAAFDALALARACAGRRTPIKSVLMDQQVVAGVGNIYAGEALFRAKLSPRRPAATLATPSAHPRARTRLLVAAVKAVLRHAVHRQTRQPDREARFRVYERAGAECPRAGCSGRIRRIVQAGRSTFYCPRCQR